VPPSMPWGAHARLQPSKSGCAWWLLPAAGGLTCLAFSRSVKNALWGGGVVG